MTVDADYRFQSFMTVHSHCYQVSMQTNQGSVPGLAKLLCSEAVKQSWSVHAMRV